MNKEKRNINPSVYDYINKCDELTQLEYVKKNVLVIQYIKNPSNKVKQLHNMLYKI